MKRVNLKILSAIFCVITLFIADKTFGQSGTPHLMAATKEHIITSNSNKKVYQLNVSLPKTYSTADTVRYPVLYVLDGKFSFTSFHSIREVLDLGKEIKDVIIVAIEDSIQTDADWFAGRYYDFTPSSIPQSDTQWSKMLNIPEGKLKSGGAELFLTAMQKDIIPFIEDRYKTNPDRGLSGHSLGGLFAGYCLLKKPGLFKSYGINSPSFWWNNNEMLSIENSFAKQPASIPVNVFFSAGALEGEMMIAPMTAFINSLKSHNYPWMTITTQIFDGESHLSVVPACSSRALKILYAPGNK